MAPVFFLLLAAVSVFAVPEVKDLDLHRDDEDAEVIVGGVPADIKEFPFIVSLIYLENKTIPKVGQGCGGAIITQDWVLTAAHCADPDFLLTKYKSKLINIRAGTSFRDRYGILRGITETVSHEFPPHDIALVKVDEPWTLNGISIALARLPRQDDPVPVGSPATIMGWGAIDVEGNRPKILMKQEVVVISHIFCNASWWYWSHRNIDEKKMCTLFKPRTEPSSILPGDSGSPVVVAGEVLGITSMRHNSNYFTIPNVHTRVSSYIDWIEETVGPLPSAK